MQSVCRLHFFAKNFSFSIDKSLKRVYLLKYPI